MTSTLCPSDAALLGSIFHGHTQEIDNSGFQPAWLESPVSQEVVSAAFSLNRTKKAVNILNIMATAKAVPPDAWPAVYALSKNGFGDVDWRNAVRACKDNHITREATRIYQAMGKNLSDPKARIEVNSWLPNVTHQLTTLFDTGRTKDSTPSALLDEQIPSLKFQSLIPEFNELWGGGYRNWMLAIYAGCPGHGKSTTLITHACDCIIQGRMVSMVVNELMPSLIARRILRGLTGLTEEEIDSKHCTSTERQEMYEQWKKWMDNHLRIYDADMYNTAWMRRIVTWDRPDALIIDYLRNMPGMLGTRSAPADPVGEMAYELLDIYRSEKVCVITAGQMSDANSKGFQKNNHAEPAIIYGSARTIQAAGIYVGTKRDYEHYATQYFRGWKNSFTSEMDVEVRVPYNTRDAIYTIEGEARREFLRRQHEQSSHS